MSKSEARNSGIPTQSPSATWRLRLLGGFELAGPSGCVRLTPPLQQLLALVALRRPTRDQATRMLWPDADCRNAQARLRTSLWRLRRACPAALDPDSDQLRIGRHLVVDVHVLAAGVSSGLFEIAAADEAARVARGGWELLPGWEHDWIVDDRERCRQLCLHGLEQVARQLMDVGQYGPAVDLALAVVGDAPLRDSGHRLVIEIHLAEANVDEALRAYERYHQLLRTELGLEPSAEIHDLLAARGVRATGAPSTRTAGPATTSGRPFAQARPG